MAQEQQTPFEQLIGIVGTLASFSEEDYASDAFTDASGIVERWERYVTNMDLFNNSHIQEALKLITTSYNDVSAASAEIRAVLENPYEELVGSLKNYHQANTTYKRLYDETLDSKGKKKGTFWEHQKELQNIFTEAVDVTDKAKLKLYGDRIGELTEIYARDTDLISKYYGGVGSLKVSNDDYLIRVLPELQRFRSVLSALTQEFKGKGLEENEATELHNYLEGRADDLSGYQGVKATNVAAIQSAIKLYENQFTSSMKEYYMYDALLDTDKYERVMENGKEYITYQRAAFMDPAAAATEYNLLASRPGAVPPEGASPYDDTPISVAEIIAGKTKAKMQAAKSGNNYVTQSDGTANYESLLNNASVLVPELLNNPEYMPKMPFQWDGRDFNNSNTPNSWNHDKNNNMNIIQNSIVENNNKVTDSFTAFTVPNELYAIKNLDGGAEYIFNLETTTNGLKASKLKLDALNAKLEQYNPDNRELLESNIKTSTNTVSDLQSKVRYTYNWEDRQRLNNELTSANQDLLNYKKQLNNMPINEINALNKQIEYQQNDYNKRQTNWNNQVNNIQNILGK